jgi:CheY-like chemotaxis protein
MIRTLIVDDEELARKRLRRMLAPFGDVDVIGEAENGAEAVTKIESEQPDLVFLDVQMPGMDGFETARRLRLLLGSQTILVALTGWSRQEDRHRSAHSGFDLHYAKPLDIAALEQLLAIPIGTSESTVGV